VHESSVTLQSTHEFSEGPIPELGSGSIDRVANRVGSISQAFLELALGLPPHPVGATLAIPAIS